MSKQELDEQMEIAKPILREPVPMAHSIIDTAKSPASSQKKISTRNPSRSSGKKIKEPKPTLKTLERAKVFKGIKDKHPEWGYDTVARKAAEELKADNFTGETVRHTYAVMGWKWVRGDRVR
jgi:hypothetical protein